MRIAARLANVLYPPACLLCHARLLPSLQTPPERGAPQEILCEDCVDVTHRNLPPVCSRCGIGLPGAFDAIVTCRECQQTPLAFDIARAPWRYTGSIRDTIHQFKYRRRWRLGRWLAAEMILTARISFPLDEITMIIPVPSYWLKRRLKGCDPAGELAQTIARSLKKPYVSYALRRRRWTPTQTQRHGQDRFRNVQHAFIARPSVAHQTVLLIDDVLTSGATASACAQALKDAGADGVLILTAARTPLLSSL